MLLYLEHFSNFDSLQLIVDIGLLETFFNSLTEPLDPLKHAQESIIVKKVFKTLILSNAKSEIALIQNKFDEWCVDDLL